MGFFRDFMLDRSYSFFMMHHLRRIFVLFGALFWRRSFGWYCHCFFHNAEFIHQLLQASIDDAALLNAIATPEK